MKKIVFSLSFVLTISACTDAATNSTLSDDQINVLSKERHVNREIEDFVEQLDPAAINFEYQAWSYLQKRCQQEDIHSIETQVDHFKAELGSRSSRQFTYFFKMTEGSPDLPTVIYLPGGPGGYASVMQSPQLKGMPVISIDPRGTGCNFYPKTLPDETITTLQTAYDVINVIRQLGLKKYVIYGTSYGTVLGTILADAIESQSDMTHPEALVLEGTLGAQIGSFERYYDSWISLWKEYIEDRPEISTALRHYMPQSKKSSLAWGAFLSDAYTIDFGAAAEKLSLLAEYDAGTLDQKAADELLLWFEENVEEPDPFLPWTLNYAGSSRVENLIACREISSPWKSRIFSLENMKLVTKVKDGDPDFDACNGLQPAAPYDAANYEITTKTYYLQGSLDPNTTLESALYHFTVQASFNNAVFLTVEGAGHRPSRVENQLGGCMEAIWDRVFAAGDFSGIVNADGRCSGL